MSTEVSAVKQEMIALAARFFRLILGLDITTEGVCSVSQIQQQVNTKMEGPQAFAYVPEKRVSCPLVIPGISEKMKMNCYHGNKSMHHIQIDYARVGIFYFDLYENTGELIIRGYIPHGNLAGESLFNLKFDYPDKRLIFCKVCSHSEIRDPKYHPLFRLLNLLLVGMPELGKSILSAGQSSEPTVSEIDGVFQLLTELNEYWVRCLGKPAVDMIVSFKGSPEVLWLPSLKAAYHAITLKELGIPPALCIAGGLYQCLLDDSFRKRGAPSSITIRRQVAKEVSLQLYGHPWKIAFFKGFASLGALFTGRSGDMPLSFEEIDEWLADPDNNELRQVLKEKI